MIDAFKTLKLIIDKNNYIDKKQNYVYDIRWWNILLDTKNIIYEFINLLNYNYNGFLNLIKKIDIKINIISNIICFLSLSNHTDNDILDTFFSDLWFI